MKNNKNNNDKKTYQNTNTILTQKYSLHCYVLFEFTPDISHILKDYLFQRLMIELT